MRNDVTAFVGYIPSDMSIWVVHKGTTYDREGDINFDFALVDYQIWPDCLGCQVHFGWYNANLGIWDEIFKEVTRL